MAISLYYSPGIAVGDILDYAFDWSDWLSAGDTINSATITAAPTLSVSSLLIDGAGVTAWLSGAVLNTSYAVTCAITTAQGRTAHRSAQLDCAAL